MPKEPGEPKSSIADPQEAFDALTGEFDSIQTSIKRLAAEPSAYKDAPGMSEDDKDFFDNDDFREDKARLEDSLIDFWTEGIAPEVKKATIQKLLESGREDVVKLIDRFSDVSEFVDEKTLIKIRGAEKVEK